MLTDKPLAAAGFIVFKYARFSTCKIYNLFNSRPYLVRTLLASRWRVQDDINLGDLPSKFLISHSFPFVSQSHLRPSLCITRILALDKIAIGTALRRAFQGISQRHHHKSLPDRHNRSENPRELQLLHPDYSNQSFIANLEDSVSNASGLTSSAAPEVASQIPQLYGVSTETFGSRYETEVLSL